MGTDFACTVCDKNEDSHEDVAYAVWSKIYLQPLILVPSTEYFSEVLQQQILARHHDDAIADPFCLNNIVSILHILITEMFARGVK